MATLYFAAPLFNKAELTFNRQLAKKFESIGINVFLPQRDGVERNKAPYNSMSDEQRRCTLFELDRDKIFESDIFFMVLDGRVPDEGACVELGLAYSHKFFLQPNKKLIGLQTDLRAAFLNSKLNPMVKVPFDFIASNEHKLIDFIKNLATLPVA